MSQSKLQSLSIKDFTAFKELDVDFSPGVNVFIGANATGKTHLLKLMYTFCAITRKSEQKDFLNKLKSLFLCSGSEDQLIRRGAERSWTKLVADHGSAQYDIYRMSDLPIPFNDSDTTGWKKKLHSIYIPTKDILGNAAGFRSILEEYELEFEEVYLDILHAAYLPFKQKPTEIVSELTLTELEKVLGGSVEVKGDFFVLRQDGWSLRFILLAEGLRKLGLLWRLIKNGSLRPGAILFWDEPESNLNPSLVCLVIEVILELQRHDVQVFVATHNYMVLKEFDLRSRSSDSIRYHSLYHDEMTSEIRVSSTNEYVSLDPNLIVDTYVDLYERDVKRDYSGENLSPIAK